MIKRNRTDKGRRGGGISGLTSYSVAVFNGSGEWRKVVFGIDVLSEHSTQTICRKEPEARQLSAQSYKCYQQ